MTQLHQLKPIVFTLTYIVEHIYPLQNVWKSKNKYKFYYNNITNMIKLFSYFNIWLKKMWNKICNTVTCSKQTLAFKGQNFLGLSLKVRVNKSSCIRRPPLLSSHLYLKVNLFLASPFSCSVIEISCEPRLLS